jgi:hypothetical protein
VKINKFARSAFMYRTAQLFSQGACIFLAPHVFDNVITGYFFTMLSLASAQTLFELGIGQTLLVMLAGYSIDDSEPKSSFLHPINLLLATTKYIYLVSSFSFLVIGGALGFFVLNSGGLEASYWVYPWSLLCVAIAGNLYINRGLIYIESIGRVQEVYSLRVAQVVIGSFIFALLILAGGELWAACAIPLLSFILGLFFLMPFFKLTDPPHSEANYTLSMIFKFYMARLFPLQWKVSISFICGFLSLQFFLPLVFKFYGPVVAGQLGLALNVMTGVTLLSSSYSIGNIQVLSSLVASNNFRSLNSLFLTSIRFSVLVCFAVLLPFNIASSSIGGLSSLLPSQTVLLILTIACLSNAVTYCCAIYLRSFLAEPLLIPSVLSTFFLYVLLFAVGSKSLVLFTSSYAISSIFVLACALAMGYERANSFSA